jgi:choline-phosphate cytidylyltransferase
MEKQRVLVEGVFDLFSLKYMTLLDTLKSQGFFTVVGVYSDEETTRLGLPVVMTEYERVETLKHSRLVDEILSPCPFSLTSEYLNEHQIDLVFVEKNEERLSNVQQFVRVLPGNEGVDADGIISRVLDQFDEYCERNLSRGYSASDMGLSSLEATSLLLRLAKKKLKTK